MPRGFVWAVYISDVATRRFARLVDADQVTDPARGWITTGVQDLVPVPIGARLRTVYGTSPTTGRRGHTVVGSQTAPLWTGQQTAFSVEANDGSTDVMTVTFRRGERFRHLPAV